MPRLGPFLKKLGIEPKDLGLYRRALTHVSAAPSIEESYERLEFLGDSIIGAVVSDFLYRQFPDKEEGDLSRIRAIVVNRETLGSKAIEMGIDKFIRADTVRVREGEQAEFSILADSFEALVGAIFNDLGYRAARTFILKALREECLNLSEMEGPADFKSRLQEMWQQRVKKPPDYYVVSESGPDHRKTFTVEVRYRGKILGRGKGSSKKRAEQEAARVAYEAEMARIAAKADLK